MEPSEAKQSQIDVHWKEEALVEPPTKFVRQANAPDKSIYDRFSERNFPGCFDEYAEMLSWDTKWHTTLDTSKPPFWKWFVGGKLNVSYNCVDRHIDKNGDKAAIIFVPEPETEAHQKITYRELYEKVNEFALVLKEFAGLKAGDRVTFHLPMIAELPISMLACARLGIIHNEVFGGFSAKACADRVIDSKSNILVTCDGYYRNGQLIDKKKDADGAVEEAAKMGVKIDKVLVWRRYPGKYVSATPMVEGRDYFVDDLMQKYAGKSVAPVSMDAEDPLFLMYTSGSTGKPKGVQHRTAGYLAYVTGTAKYVLDIHPDDIYWCLADIGWITGHSYIVYGPLSLGTTTVIYEGVPHVSRLGQVLEDRREAGGQAYPHRPDHDQDAEKGGARRPGQVQLSLQEHDDRRGAHRARVLEVVLRGRRKRGGGNHRHLVADRDRGVPLQHCAWGYPHEARERGSWGPWDLPGGL